MSLSLLLALYTFASPSNLFIYLKRRYSQQVIRELNLALKLKGKCIRAEKQIPLGLVGGDIHSLLLTVFVSTKSTCTNITPTLN